MYTPKAWQIWTKMDPARFSHWQMTGSYTKHQRTPRRQPKQCNNNRILYPSGVMTPDLSSIETRHKHCGARLTTEQQTNQCQQSHWMELWLNEHVIWDIQGSTLTECWSVDPEDYGCKVHWTTAPLSNISKYGAECDWLWTRPHNNGTDKSAKAGQSAERGGASLSSKVRPPSMKTARYFPAYF